MRLSKLLIVSLALFAVLGCGTHYAKLPTYREQSESAPLAVLKFAKAKNWWLSRAWPLELNGARPGYWSTHKRTLKIQTGTTRLLVGEGPRDTCWTCAEPSHDCLLTFDAKSGRIYTVTLTEDEDRDDYFYVVTDDTGANVADCEA